MFRDIIIPKNNEEEFINLAPKLGFKKIFFLYDFDKYCAEEKALEKFNTLKYDSDVSIEIGFIVHQKNINKAAAQSTLLAVKSSDKDRVFIENKKIKIIYGFEENYKKDYLHQRGSGLNHIICKLVKKNDINVGLSYSLLFNKSKTMPSLLIGRIMQNISLCQKYNVKTVIGSFSEKPFELRSPYDITSLFMMLGMDNKNIKDSFSCDL